MKSFHAVCAVLWLTAASAPAQSLLGLGMQSASATVVATPVVDDLAMLTAINDAHVARLVSRGERMRGAGAVAGRVNNAIGIASTLIGEATGTNLPLGYRTCVEQTQSLMSEQVLVNLVTEKGWTFAAFDTTPVSDTSGNVKHRFVLGTAPDGTTYRIDPWAKKVERYDPATACADCKGVQAWSVMRSRLR